MKTIIHWLEQSFGSLPMPLLEVWGRVAFILGAVLAIAAFGGFTLRPGGRFGLGRERQAWDAKAILSIPITFISIIVTGYLGSFIVLVPGAQTLESLKDLVVFLCIVLFGYPALLTVPFAYGLSDLIEGIPPSFLADWLPGYFINPACFWMAYQLFGKAPDFRRARTWLSYLVFVLAFFAIEPVLWGYVCSDKFSSEISYRNISSALFFTTGLTWILAPWAMLLALPLARRTGMFWAEIPGHVKERLLSEKEWLWEAGRGGAVPTGLTEGWPIRMVLLTPFIALVLLMTGATAYVALRSAEHDANKLALRLHLEIADNITLRLDEYLSRTPAVAETAEQAGLSATLKKLPIARSGLALVLDRERQVIASSVETPLQQAVAQHVIAALQKAQPASAPREPIFQFRFDHVIAKPLQSTTWLAQAQRYGGPRLDWTVLTVMPESYYLAGIKTGNSRSAMVFAVALLLSVAVAAFLASLMTARLRLISLATQSLSRGDLMQRVPSTRLAEIDALTTSWNDMAEQLSTSIGRLRGEVDMRKRQDLLRNTETRILGMIAGDYALTEILTAIVESVEALSPGTIGSILLLSSDGKYLRRGAAPGLSESFSRAVEAAAIGPRAGSCGTAAYRGEAVTVVDIETDPLWDDYRELARENNLRACWSTPIKDARGALLGTFAMYYREPRGPGADERSLIERATHLCGVAIARQLGQEQNWRLMQALGERVKELTCLHRTAGILQDLRLSTADWLREIVHIMPAAWQYPEDTAARISLGNEVCMSPGFIETPWRQSAEFMSAAGQRGCVEVAYLVDKPTSEEGPFLPEERNLINSLAEMLRAAIDARQAEEALRANERTLRQEKQFIDKLMDSLPGVVFLFNAKGTFLTWNKALEEVSGYSSAEIARLAPLDFVDREHAAVMAQAISSVLSHGQEALEIPLLTRERGAVPYYLNAVRLVTEQGVCVLGVGIDISDRRRLEEQFRQAQKMEAVGSLAGGVAHDFNNLLTVILGYSELLKDGLSASDPRQEDLEQIIATSRQASGLTRQLLTFSRKQMLQAVRFDINHNIHEMQKMLRRIIGEDIKVETCLHPTPLYTKADPGQVEQALLNLVMNARDAMPQGGKLSIETRLVQFDEESWRLHPHARPGQYVEIAMTDTGSGMTPEVRARIFEPFFTTKGIGKGTGLGLAMVYGTVQQSGGHIEVDSVQGKGSTFRIYLPLSKDAEDEPDLELLDEPVRRGDETILIVEDDETLRKLAARVLKSFGYRILAAQNGQEALQIMATHGQTVKLVIADVVMPERSGPSLAALLQQERPHLPILFVSGHTDDAVLRHGLSPDKFDFLPKPYSPASLSRKVRELLDRAR
jgi:PAS domain S-box-containing protein